MLPFVAAVVTVENTVSPGLKAKVGAKLTVLPLTVMVPLFPERSPPRWALNTFSAEVLPLAMT